MRQVYTDLEPGRGQGKQLVLFKDIPFVDEVEEFNDLMNKVNLYIYFIFIIQLLLLRLPVYLI